MEYTPDEKLVLIKKYLTQYGINVTPEILQQVSQKVDAVPREIHNMCIKIRDFVITRTSGNPAAVAQGNTLTQQLRNDFLTHSKIHEGGMTPLHARYLEILKEADRPMGAKAIAVQLGINEKAVEEDVEPLLLKLGKIEKT
jgi:Holliday junction resolvasome RuvABC ATP-dependent DNA helicase subunit